MGFKNAPKPPVQTTKKPMPPAKPQPKSAERKPAIKPKKSAYQFGDDDPDINEQAEETGMDRLPLPMDDGEHTFKLSLSTKNPAPQDYTWQWGEKKLQRRDFNLNIVLEVIDRDDPAFGKFLFERVSTMPERDAVIEGKQTFIAGTVARCLRALGYGVPVDDPTPELAEEMATLKHASAAVNVLHDILAKGPKTIKAITQWRAEFPYDESLDDEAKKKRKRPYRKSQKNFPVDPENPENHLPLYMVPLDDTTVDEDLRGLPLRMTTTVVKWLSMDGQ